MKEKNVKYIITAESIYNKNEIIYLKKNEGDNKFWSNDEQKAIKFDSLNKAQNRAKNLKFNKIAIKKIAV